jgi:hypothetical protein
MSQTVSPSTSRCYGLARVSRAWSFSRAGVYRFLKGTPSPAIARRPGPTGPCPDADLANHIRREIETSDFHGEGYRKLWARCVGRNQEKTHDGTIITDKVNEMWGTDMSQTLTLGPSLFHLSSPVPSPVSDRPANRSWRGFSRAGVAIAGYTRKGTGPQCRQHTRGARRNVDPFHLGEQGVEGGLGRALVLSIRTRRHSVFVRRREQA